MEQTPLASSHDTPLDFPATDPAEGTADSFAPSNVPLDSTATTSLLPNGPPNGEIQRDFVPEGREWIQRAKSRFSGPIISQDKQILRLIQSALAYRWAKLPLTDEQIQARSALLATLTPQEIQLRAKRAQKARKYDPAGMKLRRFIKDVRLREGMNQTQFGEMIGVIRRSIVNWETASGRLPTWKNLKRILLIHQRQMRNLRASTAPPDKQEE